jgi:DmsE family decaheme c-type cytochrome
MLSFRTVVKPAVAIAGLVAIVGVAGTARATAAKPEAKAAKAAKATVAQDLGAYVGEDTCLTCHEGQNYKGTAHALKSNVRTPAATHGCESCHGPGKAHVDGGGDKAKIVNLKAISRQESSEYCTSCHVRDKHALWSGSQHDNRNVGCVSCHSVHSPEGPKQLRARNEAETCASCHRNIVNKQYRLSHMPVREDKMSCSSCHNVHGSSNARLLKTGTTINESCTSCHAEKRGPYLWEHAPVANSCTSCHDPHGSNNDRMLVAKQPYLCQRCHVTSRHPPTIYEGYLLQNSTNSNKIFGRSCAVCHQQIHGSNAPSGKAFLR